MIGEIGSPCGRGTYRRTIRSPGEGGKTSQTDQRMTRDQDKRGLTGGQGGTGRSPQGETGHPTVKGTAIPTATKTER